MERTALYYIYGMPDEDLDEITKSNTEEVGLFEDPDVCTCGGMIKWKRTKWNSIKLEGVCTSCGKEVTRSEE